MATPESTEPLGGLPVRGDSVGSPAVQVRQHRKNPSRYVLTDNERRGSAVESPPLSEKPLPAPPSNVSETKSENSFSWRAAALPAPVPASTEENTLLPTSSVEVTAPLPTPSPLPAPRLKKKVPWKGKNIMVLLPWDDERGQKGKAPTPMTDKDVERMLQEWEELGYSTRGFNLGYSDYNDAAEQGQSRNIWPSSEIMREEHQNRNFRVSIPDRREWDAYVQDLREAKLRALGVSHGDDDPPAISPATSTLSRQNTMQYPQLPFSPPIPTSSANSSHVTQSQNPFSPALIPGAAPSTSQSSNVGSIASPASMHAQMYGKYNPRASISVTSSGEHPFGSPFQFPQQPSPGVWSPQQMLYQQGLARGGSPSLQTLGATRSPSLVIPQDGYFNQQDLAALQQRQTQLQNQAQLQMQASSARQSPRLQEIRPVVDDDSRTERIQKSPSKTPDASQFVRHNPSDSLQKEIDDAEYHLEEQFQRQLEHDDYSPHSDKAMDDQEDSEQQSFSTKSHTRKDSGMPSGLGASRYAIVEDGPELHHPQPHSRGHSLSQRPFEDSEDSHSPHLFGNTAKMDLSEIDTNPSNLGTPVLSNSGDLLHQRSFSNSSNPWLDSEPVPDKVPQPKGHKKSLSKLNVAAPEFKFDPKNSFKPGQFSFGSSTSQPAVSANQVFVPQSQPSHSTNNSFGGPVKFGSKINVTAPAFKPGNSEFSFSSSGPSFRPDAPAFTPRNSTTDAGSGLSGTEGSSNHRSSIFGNIDLSLDDIVKPPKKSKAIPIVRPDSSLAKDASRVTSKEDDIMSDKDGRITQGEGRFKRARGAANEGDSIPLFAEPSPEPTLPPLPLQETSREQSPPKEVTPVVLTQDNKENLPVGTKDEPLRVVPVSAVRALSQGQSKSLLQDSPDYDGKGWAPWEFQQQEQAQEFSQASSYPVREPMDSQLSTVEDNNSKPDVPSGAEPPPTSTTAGEPRKNHKKNSLSALAKPFEFSPSWFKFGSTEPKKSAVVPAPVSSSASVSMPSAGLSNSRYAVTPPPPTPPAPSYESPVISHEEKSSFQASLPQPQSPPQYNESDLEHEREAVADGEPSYEEIDAIMRHMNEAGTDLGVSRDTDTPRWHQPSPTRHVQIPDVIESSPIRLQPQNLMRSDAPSPSPRRFQALPGDISSQRVFSRTHDDPFMEDTHIGMAFASPVHNLNPRDSVPPSDWDDVLSEGEEEKFEARTQFFDNHVNELVGGLLSERLDPLERVLETIQLSLVNMAARTPSSRRDRRSLSGELPESDADDEDDDHVHQRSLSPRKDRKLEKIRSVVTEALAAHQSLQPTQDSIAQDSNVIQVLEEMREQFGQSMRLDLRGEDLRNIVEDAVEKRMPASPKPDEAAISKIAELEARVKELALLSQHAEKKTEEEIEKRRGAEDRLAENQRLLRISSEEEDRLRDALLEKEQKLKSIEDSRSKTTMRTALLEASAENAQKNQTEFTNKLSILETDLREARQQVQHWQSEAERALDAAKRHNDDAELANETNANMRRIIEGLKVQMEESIRTREGMRVKLGALQDDMSRAAREISQENAERAKKEQQLIARQEVLDARLQAEARTRERLEREIERLEGGEREGMRAVSESKRLEALVTEMRTELHEAEKTSMRYQREFEEARESGLSEVQRTRNYMQAEIDMANNQVNIVRQDLEDQVLRLRSELDHVKLNEDTTKEKFEMLLEEATDSKRKEIDSIVHKHGNEVDDLQTQHERQLSNIVEQAQRSEQLLLERLSLSASKTEHLQDRVTHLEERLEIAKSAAHAAAQAARSNSFSSTQPQVTQKLVAKAAELPEKISPQALRESIMVLQEQLQAREQTIEQLEQKLSTVDLDAPTKISKRDDEITWLRELLAVRKGDLEDIIVTVSQEDFNPVTVKDAAIRLKANLQMEEQERERATSGVGMYGLPNIAASLKDAATPRVAQVVGPMAAAWGNWRKQQDGSTPSKSSPQSFLSGLLTPPASSVRTPPQPTAFSNTGRRFTAQQLANRPKTRLDNGKGKARDDGPPATPPMMRKASYDPDARAEDFSDAGFYDDDESTVDDSMFGAGRL